MVWGSVIEFLAALFSQLLGHWRDVRLVVWLIGSSLVRVEGLSLLLMEPVETEEAEMIHNLLRLTLSQIKQTALTVIHACLGPLVVVDVV